MIAEPLERARRRVSRTWSAIPLRVLLVLALVILSALGLLVSGMAVTSSLEKGLTKRTDQQLRDAATAWARPQRQAPQNPIHPSSTFYIRSESANGGGVRFEARPFGVDTGIDPDVPPPSNEVRPQD
jgi:two-component system OmpR family sensor kinase